ncbi:immunoglobulin domain-containing protein [Prosthecobacter dejongeii]|nr:immunoglobulin domain-containing protein [Prosthecobacter dejongeii]
MAAPADLDPVFLSGIGVGITGPTYPDSGPTGAVQALGIQPSGAILVGGGGGMGRHNNVGELTALKRLLPDGSLDLSFAANGAFVQGPHTTVVGQASEVNAILVNADGSFFIGGVFENYGPASTVRALVAKVDADGTLDPTFVPPTLASNGAGRYVQSLALDKNGGLLIAGAFSAGGRANLIRVDAQTGAQDLTFDSSAVVGSSRVVDCVNLAQDGRIYVSGSAGNFGGYPYVFRLLPGGQEDTSFHVPFANEYGRVNRVLALPSGQVIIGGGYTLAGNPQGAYFTGLTANGAPDAAFNANLGTGANGWMGGLLQLLPDGRILAGGIFNLFNETHVASLIILNPDGTRDTTFTPAPYSTDRNNYTTHFYSAVPLNDGRIVAGGWFSRVTDPELEINNLVAFEGDGTAGAGTLKFSSPVYSAFEDGGSVTVQVARTAGIAGAVSVSYATGGGNAVAGTHYTSTSGSLSWADGESGAKSITIPLTDNVPANATRTFQVTLNGPTGGATLGTVAMTQVSILDDDSPPEIVTSPSNVTLNQGANLNLSVTVNSTVPVTFQWQYNSGSGFANILGATFRNLQISQVNPQNHTGQYRVVVTSTNGSVPSAAATVNVLTPAGSVVPSFTSTLGSNRAISAAAPDFQGRWIVVTNQNGAPTVRTLQRLLQDGTVDTSFTESTFDNGVSTVHVLQDGRILVGGFFDTVTSPASGSAVSRPDLARFQANGVLDTTYTPSLPTVNNLYVETIAPGAGGTFYVGFGSGGGLRRYLANGTLDSSFTAPATLGSDLQGKVDAVVEQGISGMVLVAHMIGRNGQGFTYNLSRLNANGTVDSGFTAVSAIGGEIETIGLYANGQKIAIGGRFSGLNGSHNPGPRMAVLDVAGNADSSFVSPFNNTEGKVSGILDQDGKLVIAGEFLTIGGINLRGVARLKLDGSIDSSFVVGAGTNGSVNSLHLTSMRDLFIAGNFTSVNGVTKNYAAELLGNAQVGTLGFEPARVTYTEAAKTITLLVRRYGSVLNAISVQWSTADALTGNSATAGTDYTAATGTLSWGPGDSNGKFITLTLLADGTQESTENFRVVLSDPQGPVTTGADATVTLLDSDTPVTFTTQPAASTARLVGESLTLTAAATSPTPISYQWHLNGAPVTSATGTTLNIAALTQAQAGLYVLVATNAAGSFSSAPAQVIVTARSGGIFAGQATAGRPSFTGGSPQAIVATGDGGVLIGGFFGVNLGNNVNKPYLIRILPNGSTDTAFPLTLNNSVRALLRQPDGKILVGGEFTSPATRLMRLNADLTLDTDFNTNVGSNLSAGQVNDIALDSTGRVYVGMSVSTNGQISRFSSAGVMDAAFAPAVNQQVTNIAVQNDDKLLVSGFFTQLAGSAANRFGRLNSDGTFDSTFTPSLGSFTFNDLLVLRDGRIFAAGNAGGGLALAHIGANGTTLSNIASSNQVYELSQAPNGKVVVTRASIGGSGSVYRIKASNPLPSPGSNDGDATFNVGTGPSADVKVVTHAPDGSIWLAGDFTTFNGVTTGGVVRLEGDPADPAIVNHPAKVGVNGGATAQMSVGAVGTNLSYQWLKNGVPLADGGRISGVTTAILTVTNVGVADDDFYSVEVTGGTPISTVTSNPAKLNVLYAPVVVSSPASASPDRGATLILTAEVLAATPATYEWRRDGGLIQNGGRYSGANTATLIIASANNADDGLYTLTVTNSQGTASTPPASVTVNQVASDRDPALVALGTTSTNSNNYVNAFLHLPDGRTLIGARGSIAGNPLNGGATNVGNQLVVIDTEGRATGPSAGNFSGTNSSVDGFFRQPDGKILVFGNFTSVANIEGPGRTRLSRLNADLSLDTSFLPVGPSSAPVAVIADGLGRIYVAGSFGGYGGNFGYNYLVRLNPDGSLDTTFKLELNDNVNAMQLLPNGKILVAGNFNSSGPFGATTTIPSLIRLNADGTLDNTFAPALPTGLIATTAVDASGRILVARNASPFGLLRLLPDGAADASFSFTATLTNAPSVITALPDGKVLVGGSFTTPTNRLFRLNEDGSLDDGFNVGTGFNSGDITAIEVDFQGRLWISGFSFTTYKGGAANRMVILQGDGPVLRFITHPASQVVDVGTASLQFSASATGNNGFAFRWKRNGLPLNDGGRVSGVTTPTLTISNVIVGDAANYTVTVTSPDNEVTSNSALLTVLSAPEILSSPVSQVVDTGTTVTFSGTARGAGTLNYQWLLGDVALTNGNGVSGATTPTLTLAGVDFADAGNYRLRVTNTISSATSGTANLTVQRRPDALAGDRPQPTFNNEVLAIHLYDDGSYLVGGAFTSVSVNGATSINRGRLARFLPDGTLDLNFSPSFNNSIRAIAVDSEGRIFVGGDFTNVIMGGITTNVTRVARFTPGLALDTAFDTVSVTPNAAGPNQSVLALAAVGDGSVYIGGKFTQIGSNTSAGVNRMARLGANGAVMANFTSGAVNDVNCIHRLSNGTLYVGGISNTWGSNAMARLVKLSATGARDGNFVSPDIFTIVYDILQLPNGSLFVAGNNLGQPYLKRLNAATGADLGFSITGHSSVVNTVARQADGKLLSGALQTFIRMDESFVRDTGMTVSLDGKVNDIAVDAQGRIYVGGNFGQINGVAKSRFAILNGGEFDSRNGLLPPQTITFAQPANRTFNPSANSLQVSASSSSSLPVSIEVTSGPATLNGSTLTITGAGEVTLTATQSGNENFSAATPVVRTFTVAKATQTINFAALSDRSMFSVPFTLSATSSSGLPVSFEWVSGPATLSGATVTLEGTEGVVTVRATQAGNANYEPAPAVVHSFLSLDTPPSPEPQTISFAPLADRLATAGPFMLSATASSGLPVGFDLVSGPATLVGNMVTPTGPSGTVTIRAIQPGNGSWQEAAAVTRSFFVTGNTPVVPVTQTITFTVSPTRYLSEGTVALSAYSSLGLAVSFEVVSGPANLSAPGVLTLTGVGTVNVRAVQAGSAAVKAAAPVIRSFKVLADPTGLTLTNLTQTYTGSPIVVGYVGVDESVEVTITYAGSETPPTQAGKYAVVATAGAVKKTGSLVINKAPLTVTADNQRKLVGQPNPSLTLSYAGFLAGDSELTIFDNQAAKPAVKPPVVTTTAKETSAGGLYSIKPAGAVAVNYLFIYVNGTLTVDTFAGQYEALLVSNGGSSLPMAKAEITVAATGKTFTGKLTTAGELAALPFKGSLTTDVEEETFTGQAIFSKGANSYVLDFILPLQGEFEITLKLNNNIVASTQEGQKLLVLAKGQTLTHTGAHTLLLGSGRVIDTSVMPVPEGVGYATATVDAKGTLKLAGKLGDGTLLTASLAADSDAGYRLFILPYKRLNSYIAGTIPLENHPNLVGRKYVDFDSEADLVWQKAPESKDKSYRAGFGPLACRMMLDPWLPPTKATKTVTAITLADRLGLNSAGQLTVAHGAFISESYDDLPVSVMVDAAGKVVVASPVTVPVNATKWKVTFTTTTGLFSGSFALSDMVEGKAVPRTVPFVGILRQPVNATEGILGGGHLLLPALSTAPTNELVSWPIEFQKP